MMANNWLELITPDISRGALDDILAEADDRELAAANDRMDLYRNATRPARPQEMSDDTYRDRCDAWSPIPLAALLVDTLAGGCYRRAVTRTTGDEALDALLAPVWAQMPTVMLQNARLAGIIGDTFVRVLPDWADGLRLSVWDGRHIVPLYDPDDPQEIIGVVFDYLLDDVAAQLARAMRRRDMGRAPIGGTQARIEIITRHIRDRQTGEIIQPGIQARFIDDVRDTDLPPWNPLGDYLPGVFWRNAVDPTSSRGLSTLEHTLPLLNAINESTTDARLLLLWNIYPIIATTADMEEAPRYDHKAVWQLGSLPNGSPASVEMLEWSQNLDGFRTYYDHLLGLLHETARVPAIATGDLTHIGELSSGRAYEIAMRPYLDTIAEHEQLYVVQELNLMRAMIAMLIATGRMPPAQASALSTVFSSEMGAQPDPIKLREAMREAAVEFAPVRLAEDAAMLAQVHSTRIGAGFESIETAIRETHPDWSDDRIREELERVNAGAPASIDASADLRIAQQQAELRAADGRPSETTTSRSAI